MIIAGFGLIFFGFGNGGHAVGFRTHGQMADLCQMVFVGFFFALSIVIGS
ncbi:hypothetical protein ACVNP1_04835 [Staphylococcus aureus]